MRTILKVVFAGAAALAFATPSQAAVTIVVPCANTNISPTAQACAGFAGGNLLGESPAMLAGAQALLNSIGFTGNAASQLEHIDLTSNVINFATLLSGTTFVGIHFGNGQGGPTAGSSNGGGTAFYRFDAGTNLNTFSDVFSANSGAVLYATGVPAVPEPGTWAMFLFGFGAIGVGMRRRKRRSWLQIS